MAPPARWGVLHGRETAAQLALYSGSAGAGARTGTGDGKSGSRGEAAARSFAAAASASAAPAVVASAGISGPSSQAVAAPWAAGTAHAAAALKRLAHIRHFAAEWGLAMPPGVGAHVREATSSSVVAFTLTDSSVTESARLLTQALKLP